jgi:hypothetical protein
MCFYISKKHNSSFFKFTPSLQSLLNVILLINFSTFTKSALRTRPPPQSVCSCNSHICPIYKPTADHSAHWNISRGKTFILLFYKPLYTCHRATKPLMCSYYQIIKLQQHVRTWHESFFPSGKPAHIILSVIFFWPYGVSLHSLFDMIGTFTSFKTSDVAPCCVVRPQPVTTPCTPVKLLPVMRAYSIR